MAHYITETCIGTKDSSCVDVCPVDCIHPRKDEPGFAETEMLYIDPETCINCALCVDACPVKAIYDDDSIPENLKKYVQINADHFKKRK